MKQMATFSSLELKLLQGKSLYPNPEGDVIVNEAFLKRLTSAQPLGQIITQADENTGSRVFGRNVSPHRRRGQRFSLPGLAPHSPAYRHRHCR